MTSQTITDIDPETKRIMEWTLEKLKSMDEGSRRCYDGMKSDIVSSGTGRSISDKGHWVFDDLKEKAENLRDKNPRLAAGIDTVIQFYEEHDLVIPQKGQAMERGNGVGRGR
ncbi:MAG: hypothetical protein EAZ74_06215 [Alphaproteobacteria bacterium]|nr:MAG: hypothetical protein EAY76_04210 [Alphaproteobacteria bacterium]TAF13237.1 MAG: hypothetical protein EAZ74_06215 [Alphaproteobacteria bacterium]TAF40911.1 MAG: hypothetical protein EAZ66_02205 [Alphaproteobacteria bacterium]TAF76867.1 MAG: hypothetical protein EAZ52_01735 [Alphaproteobacteria bacterium]